VYSNSNFDFTTYDKEIQYFLDDMKEIGIEYDR